MGRKFIDCREFPSELHCSVAIAADNEKELMDAAVQHAMSVHGEKDTPALRDQIRNIMHDGTPPEATPAPRTM